MNGIISKSRAIGAYKPFDPCRGQRRSEIFADDYVPPNIEPNLQVGEIYIIGRYMGRGLESKNARYDDGNRTSGRFDWSGAEMEYLGKTNAGYLFKSTANEWNKTCFSAIELKERSIKLKSA